MTRGKGMKTKGSNKKSLSQQTPMVVNVKDHREASKSDKVTNLRSLNELLVTTITSNRKEIDGLKNKLKMWADVNNKLLEITSLEKSRWISCEKNMKSTISELQNKLNEARNLSENHERLFSQLGEEKNMLENKLKESSDVIKELQRLKNELDQTKQLSENLENLCTQLGQEKNDLKNNLKKSNDVIRELQDKMTEDRSLWDSSKTKLEATIVEVQDKLDSAVKERNVLTQKHEDLCTSYRNDKNKLKKCNDGAKKLKAKMTENQELWDSCRVILEGKVAELQNVVTNLKILNECLLTTIANDREDIDGLKNKLKMCDDANSNLLETTTLEKNRWISCEKNMKSTISELQNKLNQANNLNENHEKLFSQLKQEKNVLESRLKESSDVIEELQGLKSELDQTKVLSENLGKLCTQLGQERNELENNLKKSDDVIRELQDKMTEDRGLWDASKTKLEATTVEVQTQLDTVVKERNALSQKHEELCTRYRNDKNEWKKCNETAIKLKAKMMEDKGLWDSCRVSLEGKVAELQNEIIGSRKSSQTNQELLTKLRQEKTQMENKLKKINDSTKKLNVKMTEDKQSWDSCKEKLEAQVSGLQNELKKHEELCSELMKEKNELENKLREYNDETKELKAKLSEDGSLWDSSRRELEATVAGLQNELNETRVLSLKHEEACIQLRHEKTKLEEELKDLNNRNEDLHAKMTENGCLWDTHKANLQDTIVNQQKKLNETKILAHNNQVLYNEICREKSELENNFNQSINEAKQLREKIAEEGHLWDTCKRESEVIVAKLQNELDEARMLSHKHEDLWSQSEHEKNELKYSFHLSIDEAKQLKEKLAEHRHMWDTSKQEFEVAIAKLQNDLNEATMLSQKHEVLWSQSGQEKNELEKTLVGLQSELDETKILRVNDQELCNMLREENNQLGNKLKQCNERIEELNAKIKEDEQLWVSNKTNLENRVADLQSEKGILIQEYKVLCTHFKDEKDELEHKIRECNDRNKELHAQMKEDFRLWEACKAQLEDSVAGLQNKLDLIRNEGRNLSHEYVELCIECEFLKPQLDEYNDILSSMEDETWSLMSLSESNAKTVEALQTQVQLITHERAHLSKKYEELTTENESLKLKLEYHNQRLDLVENERNSLGSMFESREEALLQEISSLKQKVRDLENKLGTWANDYKQFPNADMLDSATGERQFLTSLSETTDIVTEDFVTENRTVKQEALQLDQENQLSQEDIFSKKSLLQTEDGKITEMNERKIELRNAIEVLKEIGRKESEMGNWRVSHRNQTAFSGNLMSCILLDINKSTTSKCLCTGTNCILLPSDALLCGCSYGWFGGIV